MKRYRIGLDFGTSQSKVCVFNADTKTHEFFKFPNDSYFLPTRISVRDGKFFYGESFDGSTVEQYAYFKMAAADDQDFRRETGSDLRERFYLEGFEEFSKYSPELLSVLYITNILLLVKTAYRSNQISSNAGQRLLSMILKNRDAEEVRFSVRLGIPTEWSQKKNIRRKLKFEGILMISEELQRQFRTAKEFQSAKCEFVIREIERLRVANQHMDRGDYSQKLNSLGISVYPETAAGLAFIINGRQIKPGYYATMDIGGGSTDVSFFYVRQDQKIRYFASESYAMASNNVFDAYNSSNERSLPSFQQTEAEFRSKLSQRGWKQNERIVSALKLVDRKLDRLVKKLFNKRVFFFNGSMVKSFSDQPIILYGGGSRMPYIRDGVIEIHDNGTVSITGTRTFMEKQSLERYTANVDVINEDADWKKDFTLLVVALGLSYIHAPDAAEWFDMNDYHSHDEGRLSPTDEFHPINEGYYFCK